MITENDLREAIAECQGQRNPNANTCIKLAAYLTIQRELYGDDQGGVVAIPQYSYSPAPVDYQADTTLGRLIDGKDIKDVWPVFDELIETIQLINPRLYDGFIRKLKEI